ncbi:hypothetical protein BV25DRAFT_1790077, partial [Artomyces pyxidatus]
DPFQDPDETTSERRTHIFEAPSKKAYRAQKRMVCFANNQNAHAFRTSTFSIALMSTFARLLRWDQSGVIVTERFEWKRNPSNPLAEFLWRFAHSPRAARGW